MLRNLFNLLIVVVMLVLAAIVCQASGILPTTAPAEAPATCSFDDIILDRGSRYLDEDNGRWLVCPTQGYQYIEYFNTDPTPACPSCEATKPAPTTPEPPPATPAPEYVPPERSDDEIACEHINGNIEFELKPGWSINAGQITYNGTSYEFVDDRILVFRNNSSKSVTLWSSDGVGLCNSADLNQVLVRFIQGCNASGCTEVMDLNLTDDGLTIAIYKEADYCAANPDSPFCVQP